MRGVLAVVVVLVSSQAGANPSQYVQGDVGVGQLMPDGIDVLFGIEGGYRVSGRIYAHAGYLHAPHGGAYLGGDPGSGTANRVTAGAEARLCIASAVVCGLFGADLGAQRASWQSVETNDFSGTAEALLFVPRAVLDVGSASLRLRLGLELGFALASHVVTRTSGPNDPATGSQALVAGFAYQW
jgi:hypothetical protein